MSILTTAGPTELTAAVTNDVFTRRGAPRVGAALTSGSEDRIASVGGMRVMAGKLVSMFAGAA